MSESPELCCVIYARYSSKNQRDVSIEQQVYDCRLFAESKGWKVLRIYADRHLSGMSDARPEFQTAIRDAASGKWKVLLVWKTDRFARNRYDSAVYKYRLKKYGVRVAYAKESIPDGPEGILMESILEGSAEYYSVNLAQNVRRGLESNARAGIINGQCAYGYKRGEDGRAVIVPDRAAVVRDVFARYASGESTHVIARYLNDRGIPTSRGGLWNATGIRGLLSNEAYAGIFSRNGVRLEGVIPAIVDPAVFAQVAEKRELRRCLVARSRQRSDYVRCLTGRAFCGECGSPLTGSSSSGGKGGKPLFYYRCRRHLVPATERGCSFVSVSAPWLDATVADAILRYVLNSEAMDWIADCVSSLSAPDPPELASLRLRLSETEGALQNVLAAIEAGIFTPSTKARLESLEAEVAGLRQSIADVMTAAPAKVDREVVSFYLSRLRDGDPGDPDFRRELIETMVSAVYVYRDHQSVVLRYFSGVVPSPPDPADLLSGDPSCAFKRDSLGQTPLIRADATDPGVALYFVGASLCLLLPTPVPSRRRS